nr:hypothetical protein [Tanacetum cinerariifolium]
MSVRGGKGTGLLTNQVMTRDPIACQSEVRQVQVRGIVRGIRASRMGHVAALDWLKMEYFC